MTRYPFVQRFGPQAASAIQRCMYMYIAVAVAICAGSTASAQYTLTTLATFNGTNGSAPESGLIADASGNLYGTTTFGGTNENGTVFEVANDANHTLSTLAIFNAANGNGALPTAGLIADASGNLYGTTSVNGALSIGTVFEVANDANHTLSTLALFTGTNGSQPYAGLIADASGNLYGTTYRGGASDDGTVFELANDANHTLSTLATFNGLNGNGPAAGLIMDANGNLYGTTYVGGVGGANIRGTVFEVANNANHLLTTLAMFNGTNGANPYCTLIADAGGNLYGTTPHSGTFGDGTVFEVANNANHTLTTLATFNGTDGAGPFAGLIADASGNLYGTTHSGGANNDGTVFEVAKDVNHTLSILATFNGTNGNALLGGLSMDTSGNIYGTTVNGGASDFGTVFELSPVPEPSSLLLAGLAGMAMLGLFVKRKSQ
jgi:uncharacterized repeat protein (TIGR03803 family)